MKHRPILYVILAYISIFSRLAPSNRFLNDGSLLDGTRKMSMQPMLGPATILYHGLHPGLIQDLWISPGRMGTDGS